MTGSEWQAELVRLAMEACERVAHEEVPESETDEQIKARVRAHMAERMAQAAQAIVIEVDAANERVRKAEARLKPMRLTVEEVEERARLDRIDATAREVYAAHVIRFGYASQAAAYEYAEGLEEARAAWLAKRSK